MLRIDPQRLDAWAVHADLLMALGRYNEALASYDAMCTLVPDLAAAQFGRSNALLGLNRYEEALEALTQTLTLNPDLADALNNRANLLRRLNRHDEALDDYRRAIELRPGYADAYSNLGNTLRELNRIDAARDAYLRAVELAPNTVTHYYNLACVMPIKRDDPHHRALLRFAQREAQLPQRQRVELHFALGDAFESWGEHAEAFEHFLRGNALQRTLTRYNEADTLALLARLRTTCTQEWLDARRGAGDPGAEPVFVISMPRSGSTLVEQVLASHPDVYGACEYGAFSEELDAWQRRRFDKAGHSDTCDALDLLDSDALTQIGSGYRRRLRALGGIERVGRDYLRIADKSLTNFALLGLIHLAFPNARFIHVRRDAVDSCLSCFSSLLTSVPYCFDLGELGRYYAAYESVMAHWREVLPPGVLLEVCYEEMVANFEPTARALIAHCGLDWHPDCLAFDRNVRAVTTASALQVREPVHDRSVGRWRPKPEVLAPLLAELGTSA
jgi:Flp pilus assembly protein TadD